MTRTQYDELLKKARKNLENGTWDEWQMTEFLIDTIHDQFEDDVEEAIALGQEMAHRIFDEQKH